MARWIFVLMFLFPAARARAFFYTVDACIGHQQIAGPTIVNLGNGLFRWETTFQATNNAPHPLANLSVANTGACQGPSADVTCSVVSSRMSWNDAAFRWNPRPSSTVTATPDTGLELTLMGSLTNVPTQPDFGVDTGDSVPLFSTGAGALASGAARTYQMNFVLNTSSSNFFFDGRYVADGASCSAQVPALERRLIAILAVALLAVSLLWVPPRARVG